MFVQVFLRSDVLLQRSCESSSPHLGSSEKNFRTSLSSHLGTRAPSASGSTSSRSRKVRKKMEYGRLLCPVRARLFFTFLPAYLGCWRIGESLCKKIKVPVRVSRDGCRPTRWHHARTCRRHGLFGSLSTWSTWSAVIKLTLHRPFFCRTVTILIL